MMNVRASSSSSSLLLSPSQRMYCSLMHLIKKEDRTLLLGCKQMAIYMLHGHPHCCWLPADAVFVRWPSDSTPCPLESTQRGDWSERHTSMITDLPFWYRRAWDKFCVAERMFFWIPASIRALSSALTGTVRRRSIYFKTLRSIKVECWTLKEHKWDHSMIEVTCIMDYRLRHFCILVFTAWLYSSWWRSVTLQCPVLKETKENKFCVFLNCNQIYPDPSRGCRVSNL